MVFQRQRHDFKEQLVQLVLVLNVDQDFCGVVLGLQVFQEQAQLIQFVLAVDQDGDVDLLVGELVDRRVDPGDRLLQLVQLVDDGVDIFNNFIRVDGGFARHLEIGH